MKKRGAKIKHKYRADPPIVRTITDQANEIAIRSAVHELFMGAGTAQTLDVILTHLHLLQFGADVKRDEQADTVCEVAGIALDAILCRFRDTGEISADDEERKAVEMLVFESICFWKRQSGMTRDACVSAVNDWYAQLEQQREAA
jgi:hypothetical protein